jgi:hypothetical protein
MNVTRDVIRDLWALREAGEASDDSRRLVEAFLATDRELADALRSGASVFAAPPPALPPDHAAKAFDRAKQRLARRSPLRLLALAFTGLAILRLFQATTFTKSPTEVVAIPAAASDAWRARVRAHEPELAASNAAGQCGSITAPFTVNAVKISSR